MEGSGNGLFPIIVLTLVLIEIPSADMVVVEWFGWVEYEFTLNENTNC